MNQNRTGWVWGVIIVIIIVGLLAWWLTSQSSGGAGTGTATTTVQTASSTASTTGTTATTGAYANTTESTDVASIVENLSGASEFASLFTSSGVAATIGTDPRSQYTIFVPTDGAMSQLPSGTISSMTAAQITRFVQYHIVSGRAIDATTESAGSIPSLSGDALNFSYGTNQIPMVDSAIIIAEYTGSNGVVYLINNALLPPAQS